jgi:endoglycosylceramidase
VNISSNGTISYGASLLKLHVEGIHIVDSGGMAVKLTGIAVLAYDNDRSMLIDEEGVQWFKNKGFSVLRLAVYWNLIEPTKGIYDDSYFVNYVDPVIDWCEKHEVYVILDMHQWRLSPYWDGFGFPTWACNSYNAADEGRSACLRDFWQNTGVGVENTAKFIAAWEHVVNRYKDRNVIAAYELFNEPLAAPWMEDQSDLVPLIGRFYNERLVPAIRAIDPNTIIIYDHNAEPWSINFNVKQTHGNIAWASSFYWYSAEVDGSYDPATKYDLLRNLYAAFYNQFCGVFGTPWLNMEFGGDMTLDNNLQWADDTCRASAEVGNGHFLYWYYGKNDYGTWITRNADGSDRPVVAVLQKHT